MKNPPERAAGKEGKKMKEGIEIRADHYGQPTPQAVTVSFSLAYPDWCRLEASDLWRRLELAVADLQKGKSP